MACVARYAASMESASRTLNHWLDAYCAVAHVQLGRFVGVLRPALALLALASALAVHAHLGQPSWVANGWRVLLLAITIGCFEAQRAPRWATAGLAAAAAVELALAAIPHVANLLAHILSLLDARPQRAAALAAAALASAGAESCARRLGRRAVDVARARARAAHVCLLQRNMNQGKGHAATMAALALI